MCFKNYFGYWLHSNSVCYSKLMAANEVRLSHVVSEVCMKCRCRGESRYIRWHQSRQECRGESRCIRWHQSRQERRGESRCIGWYQSRHCLLCTSDAGDELRGLNLGRGIINKTNQTSCTIWPSRKRHLCQPSCTITTWQHQFSCSTTMLNDILY